MPKPQPAQQQGKQSIQSPGALQYSTTYYWKVVAWDEHGAKNESDLWHFTTEAYVPPPNHPPIITITYPNDGGIVSGNITIQGTASDEDGDETIQKVEVKIDNGKWVVATGTTSWSQKMEALLKEAFS